jgi:hypothetical protein
MVAVVFCVDGSARARVEPSTDGLIRGFSDPVPIERATKSSNSR